MRIRACVIITFGLFFALSGLIFHLLAMFSKRWTVSIPRKPRGPNDQIHYYSLWTRCQFSNTSFVMPDISSQPNIENFVCRPNTYVRYDIYNTEITKKCYESRHQCSSIVGVNPNCQCKYLLITQIQQWCCILAAIFILLAIFTFYLKLIASAQNASAKFLLNFSPVALLSLALVFMVTTMILVVVYLRRNEYEDYDIKLPSATFHSLSTMPETVNFFRLNAFFKNQADFSLQRSLISTFRSIHSDRFYARIDWSARVEIIAIIFTFIAHLISILLVVLASRAAFN